MPRIDVCYALRLPRNSEMSIADPKGAVDHRLRITGLDRNENNMTCALYRRSDAFWINPTTVTRIHACPSVVCVVQIIQYLNIHHTSFYTRAGDLNSWLSKPCVLISYLDLKHSVFVRSVPHFYLKNATMQWSLIQCQWMFLFLNKYFTFALQIYKNKKIIYLYQRDKGFIVFSV